MSRRDGLFNMPLMQSRPGNAGRLCMALALDTSHPSA